MKRLEFLRRSAGMTQRELGVIARLPGPRISLIERSRVIPPLHSVELMRLATALGMPVTASGSLLDEVGDDGR